MTKDRCYDHEFMITLLTAYDHGYVVPIGWREQWHHSAILSYDHSDRDRCGHSALSQARLSQNMSVRIHRWLSDCRNLSDLEFKWKPWQRCGCCFKDRGDVFVFILPINVLNHAAVDINGACVYCIGSWLPWSRTIWNAITNSWS